MIYTPVNIIPLSFVKNAYASFTGGDGTSSDPFQISNISQLQNVSSDLTAHYVLINDIDANATINWNEGKGFFPIGTDTNKFTGFFNGNYYTIFGLHINRSTTDNVGLFGYMGSGGSVKNVLLVDSHIIGKRFVGGLVGYNSKGTLTNCFVTGVLKGGIFIGGIVGGNIDGTVTNSCFTGDISRTGGYLPSYFGGLIGDNSGTISNCYATANVSGNQCVGGLIADNSGKVSNCYVNGNVSGSHPVGGLMGVNSGAVANCNSTGNVVGSDQVGGLVGVNSGTVSYSHASGTTKGSRWYLGGLVGMNNGKVLDCFAMGNTSGHNGIAGLVGRNEGMVSNCHATGNANGTGDYNGGLVGYNIGGTISNSFSTGSVNGNKSIGGLIGWNNGIVSNSHYNIEEVLINGGNHFTIGGLYNEQYQDWLSNNFILKISDYSSVLVPSGSYFKISNVQGLKDLLGFADVEGYKFRLASDINLSSNPGLYIPYIGSIEFDGDNHVISNIDLYLDYFSNIGFIGINQGGNIKNLHVQGSISGEENVGGLVGYNLGMMSDCSTEVNVCGYSSVGGLIGYNSHATISNCRSTGNVEGHEWVGGLVGENYCTLSNCFSTGSVNGDIAVGGLVGNNNGPISNCFTTGSVSGHGQIGGLSGFNLNEVSNCYALGSINGSSRVGGLIGQNQGTVSNCYATGSVKGDIYIGGIAGINFVDVSRCYSTGSVFGNSFCGGLLGVNYDTVSNCYATGNVTRMLESNVDIGGFVGANSQGKIINCYSTGRVAYEEATDPVDKGFAGSVSTGYGFDMRGNFWDNQRSWQITTSGNATGKNTSMMKTKTTFSRAGWDFRNVWCMIEKVTYPFLRWQDTGPPTAITGPNQIVDEGAIIVFNGSKSSDDTGIRNYTWTLIDETPVTLYGVNPTYQFNNPGRFVVALSVYDAVGLRGTDTMDVTVLDITQPIADTGPDQTIDEGTLLTFNGSSSSDNVKIINYTWEFIDGDLITLNGTPQTYRFNNPGEYLVTITVKDAAGNQDTDSMIVKVRDITPSVADAGPDQNIDEGTQMRFNGIGSCDNVKIENYTWTFKYGFDEVILYGISPTFTFNIPGNYSVRLKVFDANGNNNSDIMTIVVNDITPPSADAGEDRIVPAGTTLFLDGHLSYDNDIIKDYFWYFNYNSEEQNLEGGNVSFKFDIGGTFEITLQVIDVSGNLNKDTVTIIVIDTGLVKGIVHENDGKPIENAIIYILASNNETYTAMTGPDGSFSLEIDYGTFTWRISKEGYRSISGSSSVNAMDEIQLDLSNKNLEKEPETEPSGSISRSVFVLLVVIGMMILIISIVGITFVFIMKKKESEQSIFTEEEQKMIPETEDPFED